MQYNSFTIIIAMLIHDSGYTKSELLPTYSNSRILYAKSKTTRCLSLAAGDELYVIKIVSFVPNNV